MNESAMSNQVRGNVVNGNTYSSLLKMTDAQFRTLCEVVYRRLGIRLTEQKRSLVAGRLQKVMKVRGFQEFEQYLDFIKNDPGREAINELANRISTNHTFFNREGEHFHFFTETVLPQAEAHHAARGDRDLRIWSAGCSSGEEPYNLMMALVEHLGQRLGTWDAGILATDISADALEVARRGIYPNEAIDKLDPRQKGRYFRKVDGNRWQVVDHIRRGITFRRFNLMNRTFPFKRPFDAIFCRNVMIYFDVPTREALVGRFARWLVPGGYLFIGHSESLRREGCPLEYVRPAVYRKGSA